MQILRHAIALLHYPGELGRQSGPNLLLAEKLPSTDLSSTLWTDSLAPITQD